MSHERTYRVLHAIERQDLGIRQGWRFPAAYATDVSFLRSWLVYDSTLASEHASGERRGKFNSNFLVGLILAGGASAGFWAGIGAAIAGWR
jgi:hypothetical protein